MLLPQEVELCDLGGLSEDEYFYFNDLIESYNGKRDPAYDHIPNIVNGPAKAYLINLAISIVVGYVANKLNQKPKPKTPPSLATGDQSSQRRYAPQQGFDSLQTLATLGETIPLCFTNRDQNPNGGIRVNTKLLWSQMRSLSTSQQLKAIFLLSGGELGKKPDFAGFAIGDTLLAGYTHAKLALYCNKNGGPLKENDRIEGDLDIETLADQATKASNPFDVQWPTEKGTEFVSNIFSGSRTPSTNTVFGAYAPMPNCSMFRVPYQLVLIGHGLDKDQQDDLYKKRAKIEKSFPRYCAITDAYISPGMDLVPTVVDNDGNEIRDGSTTYAYPVGASIVYEIEGIDPVEEFEFKPWGVEDVRSSLDSIRINADVNLAVGDLYLVGSGLGILEKIEYITDGGGEVGLWLPKLENNGVKTNIKATFKIVEPGAELIVQGSNSTYLDVRPLGIKEAYMPSSLTVPMRASVATLTNNRNIECTEIGIKSTVWKQISGFANVNSHPGAVKYGAEGVIKEYEIDNGNIQLGQINKYVTRYSFFRLFARRAGVNTRWEVIDGGMPFAVRGNTPQAQYNFIKVKHDKINAQMEFKFVPYPGNLVKRLITDAKDDDNNKVRLLAKNTINKISDIKVGEDNIEVYYSGYEFPLTPGQASNKEWYIGELASTKVDTGVVTGLDVYKFHDTPKEITWYRNREEGSENIYFILMVDANDKWYMSWYAKPWGTLNQPVNFAKSGYLTDDGAPRWEEFEDTNPPGGSFANIDPNDDLYYYDSEFTGKRYTPGAFRLVYFTGDEGTENYNKYAVFSLVESTSSKNTITTVKRTAEIDSGREGSGGLEIEVTVYNSPKWGYSYPATWRIVNGGYGFENNDEIVISYANFAGVTQRHFIRLKTGFDNPLVSEEPWPAEGGSNIFPYDAIADIGMYDCERFSHDSGPEHEVAVINEMKKITPGPSYNSLALAGLRINANKEWSNFSQFSAYIKEGIKVLKLIDNTDNTTKYSSNLFPEIAFHLLTNSQDGAGKLIGADSVDRAAMTKAAKFCKDNGFYFDGVITESTNLREFIYEHANACLLDFTVLGGQFSLRSVVPDNGKITVKEGSLAVPTISGLFTDGNIRNLKTEFLSPEDRELFNAVVLWRQEKENGFPTIKTYRTRLMDSAGGSETDKEETFDLSDWCTSEKHAQIFAQYAIKVREIVDHAINFETTVDMAVGLSPGSYIKFVSTTTHVSRFSNGSIGPEGVVRLSNADSITNGTPIYYWKAGLPDVVPATLDLDSNGNETVDSLWGSVFTTRNTETKTRVYKIESISFVDDGFIEVAASYCPIKDSNSQLEILDWEGQFTGNP